MSAPKVYGYIKARATSKPDQTPLAQTFVNRTVYDDTLRAMYANDKITVVDKFWGYDITSDANKAVEAVLFWS